MYYSWRVQCTNRQSSKFQCGFHQRLTSSVSEVHLRKRLREAIWQGRCGWRRSSVPREEARREEREERMEERRRDNHTSTSPHTVT